MNARNIASISALTPTQEGILFHAIADDNRAAYHSQFSARIDGDLDAARWRAAWDRVIARHDVLRTLFTWEGRDKPLQIVRERVETPWQTLDWSATSTDEHPAMLDALLQRDRDLGFQLDRAPLLRLILIRLGPERQRFVLTFHHLILDGWSMRLLLDEAQHIYTSADALPGHAPSFTRFVEWLAARDTSGDEAWWRERLSSFDTPTFPQVHDGTATDNVSHHVVTRRLDRSEADTLRRVAREQRVTPSSVVAAAWALLLARYAGTDDVVFGTTVAGRPPELGDVEHMAGMFINTLPLRIQTDANATVADLLQSVQHAQAEQRDMEASALSVTQRASGVTDGEPLFESILVFENFPAAAALEARNIALSIDHFVEYSHFPLAILAVPDDPFDLIGISDPEHLGVPGLTDLMDNLRHTLRSLLANPGARLTDVSTLASEQSLNVLETLNDTEVATPESTTLWHQTAAHAEASPEAVALIDAGGATTYRELMRRANAVSAALLEANIVPGDPVLIVGPRGAAAVSAIVGVHGAGGAYVPIAADAPTARVTRIVAELTSSGRTVHAIVAGEHSATLPADVQHVDMAHVETITRAIAGPNLSSAAYYMFTSGSTGTPKGVEVSQKNLFHSVHARDGYYDAPPATFALLSSLATDSSVAGLFWTLGRGGTLLLPAERSEQDIAGLIGFLDSHNASHLLTVPSLYAVILEHAGMHGLPMLNVAIVAGEACPESLVEAHHRAAPKRQLHNEYGPTETTVWCTSARLEPNRPVSIGRPLVNTKVYVLDAHQQPLPVGVAGELYVGGPQVATGYVGDTQRTAAQFVRSPFAADERLYRTGDRVRWRRDGTLQFVGRVDEQIKVRGYRVEPGEIEARLCEREGVREAVVLLHSATPNAPLTAFVVGTSTLDAASLRRALAEDLPGYMVPQHIHLLDAMPRTAAGKADRRALSTQPVTIATPVQAESTRPATDAERTLADIWRDVLGVDSVGLHDDFFALGGDSLLSIRVLARAGKAGLRIAAADFFAWPTVAGQAAHADQSGARRISQKPVVGAQPLMPIQHWFFDHIRSGRQHWNLSYLFEAGASLALADVQRAVAAVLTTHDSLRSGFEQHDGRWHCRLHAPQEFDVVSQLDLRQCEADRLDGAITGAADTLNAAFDLATPPLLRVCLIDMPQGQPQRVLIVVHHLIVDAESWRILIEDLELALGQTLEDQPIALPAKTDALTTFSKRLIAWSQEDSFADIALQWQTRLAQPAPDLAPDESSDTFTEAQTREHVIALSEDDTSALLASTSESRATTLELLLAGVASALGQHLDAPRVRLEMEGHGREAQFEDLDISRTVGWMTTAFPITIEADGAWQDASGVLRQVKNSLREIPQRGLSYGVIMAGHGESAAAKGVREQRRSRVLFNFLGQRETDTPSRLLQLVDERCGQARSGDAPRAYLLEMNAVIYAGQLTISMAYPAPAVATNTIEQLGQSIHSTLRALAGNSADTVVPQDFPLANLDQQGLSDLSDLLDELDD